MANLKIEDYHLATDEEMDEHTAWLLDVSLVMMGTLHSLEFALLEKVKRLRKELDEINYQGNLKEEVKADGLQEGRPRDNSKDCELCK